MVDVGQKMKSHTNTWTVIAGEEALVSLHVGPESQNQESVLSQIPPWDQRLVATLLLKSLFAESSDAKGRRRSLPAAPSPARLCKPAKLQLTSRLSKISSLNFFIRLDVIVDSKWTFFVKFRGNSFRVVFRHHWSWSVYIELDPQTPKSTIKTSWYSWGTRMDQMTRDASVWHFLHAASEDEAKDVGVSLKDLNGRCGMNPERGHV